MSHREETPRQIQHTSPREEPQNTARQEDEADLDPMQNQAGVWASHLKLLPHDSANRRKTKTTVNRNIV